MDHIPDLSAFQGVILSADNHCSFSKLKSKGGNEEKIKYVVDKLFNFLEEKNYITKGGIVEERSRDYEKLAMYLVLNADLPELERMTELDGVGAHVGTLPTLPAALLAELLWGLHMGRFLRRAVEGCAPRLALQLADAVAAQLRHLEPRQLERPALLARALFGLLPRLAPAAAPRAAAALRACLAAARAAPAGERARRLPDDDRYELLADALLAMLRLVRDRLAGDPAGGAPVAAVYLATRGPAEPAPGPRPPPDPAVLECLRACDGFLLDDCTALAMAVSVDAFCAWSEVERGGRSLQRAVAELAHGARAALLGAPAAADHALAAVLAPLARPPPAVAELVAAADDATVAERIRAGDAAGAAWLAAALELPDLTRRPALLRAVAGAAAALDEASSERLFDRLAREARAPPENSDDDLRKTLAIEAFQRCGDAAKDRILAEQFREHLHDAFEPAAFEAAAADTLNRLVQRGEPGGALALFLQSPRRTLARVLRAAGGGAAPAALALRVLARLGAALCARGYAGEGAPALALAAGDALAAAADDPARRARLAGLLAELARRGLLARARLLALALARPAGGAALLRAALGPPAPPPAPRAALLAALAQRLDAARARLALAAPDAPDAPDALDDLDCLLELLDELLAASRDRLPEAELSWLRARLRRAAPLTRAHFGPLRGEPAAPAPAAALAAALRDHPVDVVLLAPREWRALLGAAAGAPRGQPAAARGALRRAARACGGGEARAALQRAHCAAARALKSSYLSSPATEQQVANVLKFARAVTRDEPELARAWAPLRAELAPRPAAGRV